MISQFLPIVLEQQLDAEEISWLLWRLLTMTIFQCLFTDVSFYLQQRTVLLPHRKFIALPFFSYSALKHYNIPLFHHDASYKIICSGNCAHHVIIRPLFYPSHSHFRSIFMAGFVEVACYLYPPGSAKRVLGIVTEGLLSDRQQSVRDYKPLCQDRLTRHICLYM